MKKLWKKVTVLLTAFTAMWMFSACGKEETPAKEFAYLPAYTDLQVDCDYISGVAADEDLLYLVGSSWEEGSSRSTNYLYQYDLVNGTNHKLSLDLGENSSISQMAVEPDGNLSMIVNTYEYTRDENNEIIDAKNSMLLQTVSVTDGSVLDSRELTGIVDEQEFAYIQHFCVDGEGNRYFFSDETGIRVTDKDLNIICDIPVTNWVNGMVTSKEGTVFVANYGENGMEVKPVDLKKKGLGDAIEGAGGYSNLALASGASKSLLIRDDSAVSLYDAEIGSCTELFQWIDADVNINNLRYAGELSDGRIWAISEDYSEENNKKELILISRVKASEVPQKEEITYGAMNLDYNVRESIIEFNKSSDKYHITVKEYGTEDYETGLAQFHGDLTSANCPDIIDLSSIDYSMYAGKGVLEDLYPYMEKSGMQKEDYLENILAAYEVDGKLYGMMPQFYVSTTMVKAAKVGDVSGWTLSEMLDFAEKEKAENLFAYGTRSSVFSYCIYSNIDEFINWETGECHFDGEDFIRTLEFAAQFPEEYDYNEEQEGIHARIHSDQVLLMNSSISSVQEFQMMQGMFGENIAYVGYPNSERKGNLIQPTGGSMAMSAKSKHKEGAWEFMSMFLSEEYQNGLVAEHSAWGFPVKKSALEAQFEKDMTQEYYTDETGKQVEQMKTSWSYDDFNVDIYAATEEEVAQVRALIESADRLSGSTNAQLEAIIMEEAEAFFKGQKSAADTAGVIQNRIQIYVNENR